VRAEFGTPLEYVGLVAAASGAAAAPAEAAARVVLLARWQCRDHWAGRRQGRQGRPAFRNRKEHLVRPTLTISGIRGPLQLWKLPSRLSFDGVIGSRHARHRRCSRRHFVRGGSCAAPGGGSQRATQLGKLLRQRTLSLGWTTDAMLQDASKPMLPASVLQALQPTFDGSCGINLRCALPAVSAHAR